MKQVPSKDDLITSFEGLASVRRYMFCDSDSVTSVEEAGEGRLWEVSR